MALSPQWLDELRSRITLSSVIMRTTKLQRAGREWKACCPFHNEKTPSFTVNDQKGFYHCFGCQAHGDVISWMTDQRGLSFMDAVKELAAEAGMEVPRPDPREAQRAEQRAGLHDVMQAAQDWFVQNLRSPQGKQARDYLASRGFNDRTIERFGFGFAPDSRGGLKEALSRFDEHMLVEAGLLISVDDKPPYDRFRGRLMLPIQDARERVIAFGGRILESRDGVAKYLNSPDTPLFDKGRTLYNIHRAAPASRQSDRVVVVEGYMDVIALAAAGFEDAVAPMGTALTDNQIELLWRMVEKPVLCFDGDAAGRRAAMKAVSRALPLLRPGHSLQIVQLPGGLDPDDLIKQQGAKAMEQLLAAPKSMLELVWEEERDARPLASPEDKAGLKERLLAHADAIQHPDIRSLYRREWLDLYSAFAFPKREFQKTGWQPGRQARPFQPAQSPQMTAQLKRAASGNFRDMLAQAVLAGLARHPDQIDRHAEQLLRLTKLVPESSAAVDYLLDAAETLEDGANSPISASGILPPPPDNTRFSFLVEGSDPDDAREDLAEAIALLVERPQLDAAIAAATSRFETDPEGAFAEQQRLRKRKLEIESRLGQMARKRAAEVAPEGQSAAGAINAGGDQETD
ncbi:DNA primase [Alteraurantiacibacter aquimixticola]|uniref:DNA primase n=1 Tax=Alteraurantiacibacter aquimixticola TaxID=2489173 RepID=A0A4V4U8I6_9SPHN|nr:DNA primase [Alteraurantiacibacter aquimixticola]TIX50153.1 DNA primase [Alteraurantiacibacter aquimixticola]